MEIFNLGVAWCWEYDYDFICDLEKECLKRGLSIYLIAPHNLEETIKKLKSFKLHFDLFFDRASDQDESFEELVDLIYQKDIKMINDFNQTVWAIDKATMHLEFLSHQINVPYTFILSPYEEKKELEISEKDLTKIKKPFVIKPACGGCGEGVIVDACGLDDIKSARKDYELDKYLVQEKINPFQINGKRAWFRVFFCCGRIFPCFWDDQTKIASLLKPEDVGEKTYSEIENIIKKIAKISKLDLFSSEIALNNCGKLIVIDHVNDQIDLRKKSKHFDGIPDEVVWMITSSLVDYVERITNCKATKKETTL